MTLLYDIHYGDPIEQYMAKKSEKSEKSLYF